MRKREERFNWLTFTPAEQLHIIKLCRQRYRRKMLGSRIEQQAESDPKNPQQDLF